MHPGMNTITFNQSALLLNLKNELKLQWLVAAFSVATALASIGWDSARAGGLGGGPGPSLLIPIVAAQLARSN